MIENIVNHFASLHPFFVHFPISFLLVYGLLALARATTKSKRLAQFAERFEGPFIFLGTLAASVAYLAGDSLSETMRETKAIELHESFASLTLFVSSLIFALYFAESAWNLAKQVFAKYEKTAALANTIEKRFAFGRVFALFKKARSCRFAVVFLATTLLTAISITGALGAGIAHGQGVDAIVSFVYSLFGF